ncbi:hypothetical protein SNE26_07655 [Mucilaginibacter sp. cycad4]|uniref:hypothetical protein n=1 Tax=Mucilaginibacter sp. cycad4 TaxID=3342096 RepID=UPI002AAADBE3|nr:hypothetical protein [Mucilaginibacter gossypii]WPV01647.1 hypothetical protein SNE26_07655 [Mucilaginibacter gossypii]
MNQILKLNHRANMHVISYGEKYVIVYEDHRYLLNVLYFLKAEENFKNPFNIIYFDFHDDAVKPHKSSIEITKKFRATLPTMPEFWSFTEFNISTLDDDWVLNGMELGFIKDAVVIGAEKDDNIARINNRYSDHTGIDHRIYSIPHLWDSLDRNGCLGEQAAITDDFKNIREILEFNNPRNRYTFTDTPETPYILDFDCDVFSFDLLGKTSSWPYSRMRELFLTEIDELNTTPRDFVERLIDRATIITICRETPYCGGILQATNNFHNLDTLFFNGELSK